MIQGVRKIDPAMTNALYIQINMGLWFTNDKDLTPEDLRSFHISTEEFAKTMRTLYNTSNFGKKEYALTIAFASFKEQCNVEKKFPYNLSESLYPYYEELYKTAFPEERHSEKSIRTMYEFMLTEVRAKEAPSVKSIKSLPLEDAHKKA